MFSISPNPTSSILHVQNSQHELMDLQLFSRDGKLILRNNQSDFLNLQNLPEDLYILKINTPSEVGCKKVMKLNLRN